VTRPWGTINTDPRRRGPPSEPGEYAFDVPPLFGTQNTAPDLGRVGLKCGDEWHLAHFWNPPMMTQGSITGGFSALLFDSAAEPVPIVDNGAGGRTLARTPATEKLFDFGSDQRAKLTANEQGVLFVPMIAQGKNPLIWTPDDEYAGDNVKLVAETKAVQALTAYVHKLGTNRGRWRDMFEPEVVDGSMIDLPRSDEWIAHGKQVFERNCVACHGVKGDGNGWAATFLYSSVRVTSPPACSSPG
jgi:cytochrome c oxidase cbb3-type subunit I/II